MGRGLGEWELGGSWAFLFLIASTVVEAASHDPSSNQNTSRCGVQREAWRYRPGAKRVRVIYGGHSGNRVPKVELGEVGSMRMFVLS